MPLARKSNENHRRLQVRQFVTRSHVAIYSLYEFLDGTILSAYATNPPKRIRDL